MQQKATKGEEGYVEDTIWVNMAWTNPPTKHFSSDCSTEVRDKAAERLEQELMYLHVTPHPSHWSQTTPTPVTYWGWASQAVQPRLTFTATLQSITTRPTP